MNPNELVELLAIYDELRAKIQDAEQLVAQQYGGVPKEVSTHCYKCLPSIPYEHP